MPAKKMLFIGKKMVTTTVMNGIRKPAIFMSTKGLNSIY